MAAIVLDKLSIGYTHNRQQMPIMGVIDATLECGEFVALIGANGAGKSTLLRTLSAFQRPLGGTITYPDGDSRPRNASELATQLAVVLTSNSGLHSLTVREVVAMGRSPYTNFLGRTRAHDEEIMERAMSMVGITHLSGRRIETLSDGERQKTMIAKALAQETPVIMLDEPTAFFDFSSRVQLFRLLQKLAHDTGKAILVSTHDLELVLRLADKVWLIHNKKMHTGGVDELAASGVLPLFIEGDGIKFNPENNCIEVKQ